MIRSTIQRLLPFCALLGAAFFSRSCAAQDNVKARIIHSWRDSFRALHSLEYSWSDDSIGANYNFLWNRGKFRVDTRFTTRRNDKSENTAVLSSSNESGFFTQLEQTVGGKYRANIRQQPMRADSPYDVPLPVLLNFRFVLGAKGDKFSLEWFQTEAPWKSLEARTSGVQSGSWQGHRGHWLTISNAEKARGTFRVFAEEKHNFPIYFENRRHRTLDNSLFDTFVQSQTTRTTTWRAGGREWLFPLDTNVRAWIKQSENGQIKRRFESRTTSARVKINRPLAANRFPVLVPAGTPTLSSTDSLVSDAYFRFDPKLSPKVQALRARQELDEYHRRIAAAPKIWDEDADGKSQIAAALGEAKTQNKRVLLQFGANLCGPCRTLHDVLHQDPQISALLKSGFVVVDIDYGKNSEVNQSFKLPNQEFAPTLVVLDQQGQTLARANDDLDLSRVAKDGLNSELDVTKIKTFLLKWTSQ